MTDHPTPLRGNDEVNINTELYTLFLLLKGGRKVGKHTHTHTESGLVMPKKNVNNTRYATQWKESGTAFSGRGRLFLVGLFMVTGITNNLEKREVERAQRERRERPCYILLVFHPWTKQNHANKSSALIQPRMVCNRPQLLVHLPG